MKGATSKSLFKGSEAETRELLGGTEENRVSLTKQNEIELVARPVRSVDKNI